MAYTKSPIDILSEKLAPVRRKLHDRNVEKLLGTKVEVLRIVEGATTAWESEEDTLDCHIINNVIITKPFASQTRIFSDYNDSTKQLSTESMDLWEYLPIEMKISFDGDVDTEIVSAKEGDMIVEILQDEFGNKIPFIMQVSKIFGSFSNRFMVGKKYQLNLYRGQIPELIKDRIDRYISGELTA